MPNLRGIFSNGTVAGEFPCTGNVHQRHLRPGLRLAVKLADALLRIDVALQVRQQHIAVAEIQQCLHDRLEETRLKRTEVIVTDGGDGLLNFGVGMIEVPRRVVALSMLLTH